MDQHSPWCSLMIAAAAAIVEREWVSRRSDWPHSDVRHKGSGRDDVKVA
jgi:hypothetical protein